MAISDYRFASTLNPYGLDKNNNLVCVDDVPQGLDCGCVCPTCKVDFIAKKGEERIHHFAHRCDDDSCLHIQETYYLRLKEILERNKRIMLPWYKNMQPIQVQLKNITEEKRIDRRILPDLVVETEDGVLIHIRFKRKRGRDLSVNENDVYLELDANEIKINDLEFFLLDSVENKKWINFENMIEQECQINWAELNNCFSNNAVLQNKNTNLEDGIKLQRRIKKELQENEYICKKISFCKETCQNYRSCNYVVENFIYKNIEYVICCNPELYFQHFFPQGKYLDFIPKNASTALDEYEMRLAINKHFTLSTRIYDWSKNENNIIVQHIDDVDVLYATKIEYNDGKYIFTDVEIF
jgi:hypothetical protein